MKTVIITFVLVAFFSLTSYSQDKSKNKPVEVYQVGSSKVVVWENVNKNGDTWRSYQIEKIYQTNDGEWKTSNSFNSSELLELRLVIEKAMLEESFEKNKK